MMAAMMSILMIACVAVAPAEPAKIPASVPAAKGDAARAQVTIRLRGQNVVIDGALSGISPAGVTVQVAEKGEKQVSWDAIRVIEGLDAQRTSLFMPMADGVWRGRSRLERGDYVLAEEALMPVYEAFAQQGSLNGPTGAVLCEGVLRCRLNRGWTTAAVTPWLQWRGVVERAKRLGYAESAEGTASEANWVGGGISGAQVTDLATGLCTQLPPIFSAKTSARALPGFLAAPIWQSTIAAGGTTGQMAVWYQRAAAGELAISAGAAPEPITAEKSKVTDAGLALVQEIVLSRVGSSPQRGEARAALERRLSVTKAKPSESEGVAQALPAWQEAWIHAAIGRSLLLENEQRLKRQGLVELLHVPARFADQQPFLAALVLREAVEALREMGESDGAMKLNQELISRLGDYASDESLALTVTPKAEPEAGAGRPDMKTPSEEKPK